MASGEITINEAAEALAVSSRTVRRWIKSGRLPAGLRHGPNGPQYFIPLDAVRRDRASDSTRRVSAVDREILAHQLADELRDDIGAQMDAALERWSQRFFHRVLALEQQLTELRTDLAELRRAIDRPR